MPGCIVKARAENDAVEGRVVRPDIAGELVEHACRSERLPDHVRRRDGLADRASDARPIWLVDVVGPNDAGDAGEVGAGDAGRSEAVDRGPGIDEAGRRFDEPALAQIEIVARRCRDRIAVGPDWLVGEGTGRVVQVDICRTPGEPSGRRRSVPWWRRNRCRRRGLRTRCRSRRCRWSSSRDSRPWSRDADSAVVVETGDVGADLRAREGLGLSGCCSSVRRGIDDGAALVEMPTELDVELRLAWPPTPRAHTPPPG